MRSYCTITQTASVQEEATSGRSSSARKTAKGLGKASTIPEEEEDAESMTRYVKTTAKRVQKLKKNRKPTRASRRLKENKLDE